MGLYHDMSNDKNRGYLEYIGDYTTQLYGDYFISHCYKDPVIKQAKNPIMIP